MRLHDRYLLREFLGYLTLGLLGFIVIFIVVDVFEKMDIFLDHKAPASLVLSYYVNLAPDVVVKVLPVALLLATFLSLGQLNKFGELTALRASGISIVRLLMPVFLVAVACVLVSFALSELVVPGATRTRNQILQERIQRIQRSSDFERADVTYLGAGGRIWYMRLYLVREQRMHEVSLQEFERGELLRRIDASEATWDGERWVFASGFTRTFDADGRETATPFQRLGVQGLAERPADFAKESRSPDEMNVLELRDYVTRLRTSGARVSNYVVDLHLKLAFPIVCFVVVLIGGALATRLRMQSAALGFGLSVGIAFLYYGFLQAGKAFGHSGLLPPMLAAWMGDLVFGTIGLIMMWRAQRH